MFFTCVKCFERRSTCFSLCLHCYNAKKFIHKDTHRLFLDNYALLEAMRETVSKAKMDGGVKVNDSKQSASLAMLLKIDTSEGSTSSPGPIVPLNNKLPNFTTKPNTSSLGPIVPVINKTSTTKAITSSAHSLVKVINKTTSAKDTFEALEGAMNMAIAAAMTVSGFSAWMLSSVKNLHELQGLIQIILELLHLRSLKLMVHRPGSLLNPSRPPFFTKLCMVIC
ncbi:hypothetical protein AAG906_016850 [Vitis piasezkii]